LLNVSKHKKRLCQVTLPSFYILIERIPRRIAAWLAPLIDHGKVKVIAQNAPDGLDCLPSPSSQYIPLQQRDADPSREQYSY